MKTVTLFALVCLACLFCATAASATASVEKLQEDVARAEKAGIVLGSEFAIDAAKADTFAALMKSELAGEGAVCKIECGKSVAGVVCPVGQVCKCSCAGGGPDCGCYRH